MIGFRSTRDANRLVEGARTAERLAREGDIQPDGPQVSTLTPQIVRVTSGSKDKNGDYPAQLMAFDSGTAAWVDFGEVRFRSHTNTVCGNGDVFTGRFTGPNVVGDQGLFTGVGNGDATAFGKDGAETAWAGGLLSTGLQSIKGIKRFRDYVVVQQPVKADGADVQASVTIVTPSAVVASVEVAGAGHPVTGNPSRARLVASEGEARVQLESVSLLAGAAWGGGLTINSNLKLYGGGNVYSLQRTTASGTFGLPGYFPAGDYIGLDAEFQFVTSVTVTEVDGYVTDVAYTVKNLKFVGGLLVGVETV